ncbi:hypothetical protein [Dyadobacter chenhuakuii]|uniref:Uncharacterized protein n=1 Tax=Dyadobacter chenhuakuii TaxID=2909339 RepID=A0ABY4XNK5_9BACT|nr:hypothetical protein [Dyadobacter chenhuakuii]MCF2495049.1 hypothetical protein [Dyadobacter chenhuakuii]USJ31638.1 hypothetical protein NFI80_02640 [Dyadobacter chenhuakuii]
MIQTTKKSNTKVVAGVNTDQKQPVFLRMLDDKKAIYRFFQGEISIDELNARGIKFIKPL